MSIDDIVTITLTTNDKGISQAGFGMPAIFGYHTAWMNYSREYTDVADLVTDGIAATSPIYKIASSIMAQNPHPPSFKVLRRATAFSQTVNITPTVGGTGYVHTVKVVSPDGTETTCSYTEQASDTVALICAALQTSLDAITDLTATDNTTHVTCAADNDGELFFYNEMSASLQLIDNTADPGIAADIAAIRLEDDDWYGFCMDSQSEAQINGAQAVIETLSKVAMYDTADYGAKDSTETDDVMSDLQDSAYDRCLIHYSADHDGYLTAGLMGLIFPNNPGKATWANKTVSGPAVDTLNATEQGAITAKNGNYYITIKDRNLTSKGITPGGSFMDVIRGRDWFTERLKERIVLLMANSLKIPFTDSGGDMIRAQIWAQIREGQSSAYNLIAESPEPTVYIPPVSTVSTANKAARIWPDITLTFTLQGAVHKVIISGVASV